MAGTKVAVEDDNNHFQIVIFVLFTSVLSSRRAHTFGYTDNSRVKAAANHLEFKQSARNEIDSNDSQATCRRSRSARDSSRFKSK